MYIQACSSEGLMAVVSGTRSLLQPLICKLAGVGGLMRTKVKGCVSPEPMCSIPKQVLFHQTHLQLWPDSYRTYYPDRSSCSCPGLQRRCQLACQTCVRLTYSRIPQGKDVLSNPAHFFKSHMLKTSHRLWVHLSLPQGTLQPYESHQGGSPRHRDHPALLPVSMWRREPLPSRKSGLPNTPQQLASSLQTPGPGKQCKLHPFLLDLPSASSNGAPCPSASFPPDMGGEGTTRKSGEWNSGLFPFSTSSQASQKHLAPPRE